jgi:hypothetical protein
MQWLTELRINGLERALGGLDWLARKRGREQSLPAHLLTGIEGEEAAYFHLRRKNYVVVARRWSGGNLPGDIDLIAWQGQLLCFIEVKTRTAREAPRSAPAGAPVCAPTAAANRARDPVRRSERLSCARRGEGVPAL